MTPQSRLVTVIGGTGFIGKALVDRLVASGHTVRIVSRNAPRKSSEDPKVSYMRADVADPTSIRECVRGAGMVFHLATGGGSTWADYERDFVQGTRTIATTCMDEGVQRLVYTSSVAALYLGAKRTITDETKPDDQPKKRAPYARAKICAEQILMELHRRRGLPVVIFRPGVVMGKGGRLDHSGFGTWNSDTRCLGWDQGTHPLPFVLVEDVAKALVAAMDRPGIEGKSFNLVGDIRPSAQDFIRAAAERAQRNFRFYPQRFFKLCAVEALKCTLKALARKADNPPPSLRDLRSRSLRAQFDCSGAKQLLGWKPTDDLKTFLAEAIDNNINIPIPGDLRLLPRIGL
jgi:nucleoside-diphosphate-sugar epimerase